MNSLYHYFFYFFIYSFLGWCREVCFRSVNTGRFYNSGFLNGPYCPIYGFGMVIVIYLLSPVQYSLPLLFAGAFVLTTLLEGVTGWLLHRLFHTRWWDYTDMPFNIGGYVCPAFSVMWGIGGCFIMRLVHPAIAFTVDKTNRSIGLAVLVIMTVLFIIDTIVTVNTVMNLNRDLDRLEKMAEKMHNSSENIAMKLGNAAIETGEKLEQAKLDMQMRNDIARAELMDIRVKNYYRLLKAFPNMKHDKYNHHLKELKNRIQTKEKRR